MSKAFEALDQQRGAIMLAEAMRQHSTGMNREFYRGQGKLLSVADACFWRRNAVERVQSTEASFNLSAPVVREQLYRDVMFWWFERPRFIVQTDVGDNDDEEILKRVEVCALLTAWIESHDGVGLLVNPFYLTKRPTRGGVPPVPGISVTSLFVRRGQPWGELRETLRSETERTDVTPTEADEIARFLLAGNVFMRQRLLESRPEAISLGLRKKLTLEGVRQDSEALLVSLRAVDYDRMDSSRGESNVERDFQWWTRGHPREQWYPSLDAHLTIWIDAHLNGPAGTPIKPRLTPVFDVRR